MICYRDRVRCGVREITHSIVVEFDAISFQAGILHCSVKQNRRVMECTGKFEAFPYCRNSMGITKKDV